MKGLAEAFHGQRRLPLPRGGDQVAQQEFDKEHVPRLQGEQNVLGLRIVLHAVVPGEPIQAGFRPRPILATGLAKEIRPLLQRGFTACWNRQDRLGQRTNDPWVGSALPPKSPTICSGVPAE